MALETQIQLYDAVGLCEVALIRLPATSDLVALEIGVDRLLKELDPALDLAWPDRPAPDNLEEFLVEAHLRLISAGRALAGQDGYVPAAEWTPSGRDMLLEHLRDEVDALIGGTRTEGLWEGFGALDATAAVAELVETGMITKVRAVSSFLVSAPSRYDDELTAAEFFPVGEWAEARDEKGAAHLAGMMTWANKTIAHLTLSRPIPEDRYVYRPGSYRGVVETIISLLEQFTAAVDSRLVPDWWTEWVSGLLDRLRT